MIIIRNNIIPFKGYKCINLFGILFVRKNANIDIKTINHELIHTAQMKEMLFIFFYLWYCIEYLCILFSFKYSKHKDRYHDISFEEEAFNNDENLEYLSKREHYAWIKYLKIGSYKK